MKKLGSKTKGLVAAIGVPRTLVSGRAVLARLWTELDPTGKGFVTLAESGPIHLPAMKPVIEVALPWLTPCPTEDVDPNVAASCCRERQLCVTWPRHSEELWPRQVWKMVSSFKIALMQRCPCSSFAKQSSMTLRIRYGDMLLAWQESIDVNGAGVGSKLSLKDGILRAPKSNLQAKCPRVRLRTASRSLVGGLRPSSQAWESEIKGGLYVPSTKSSVFCSRMSAGCWRNSCVSNETGRRGQTEIVNGCLLN